MARKRKRVRVQSYLRKVSGRARRVRVPAHFRLIAKPRKRRPAPKPRIRASRVKGGRFRITRQKELAGLALRSHLAAQTKRFGPGKRKATKKQRAQRKPRIRVVQRRREKIIAIDAHFKIINPGGRISFFRKRLRFIRPVKLKTAEEAMQSWREQLLNTYIDVESLEAILSVEFRMLRVGEKLNGRKQAA